MNGHHRAVLVLSAFVAAGCAQSTNEQLTHALATLDGVGGAAVFSAANGQVTVQLYVTAATPGSHPVKVQPTSDCRAADAATPFADLGTLEVKEDGTGTLRLTSSDWTLDGAGSERGMIGRSIVIYGTDGAARAGCGAVRRIDGGGMPNMMMPPAPSGRTVTAQLLPRSGSPSFGAATFTEVQGGVEVKVTMSNLSPGSHGVHLHQVGDCSDGAGLNTGGHWNVDGSPHPMHIGDMPNMTAGPDGSGTLTFLSPKWSIDAPLVNGQRATNDVIGHAVIIHAAADDLMSQPAGNAGARVACGVVGQPAIPAPTVAVARLDARSGTTLSGQATFRAAANAVTLTLDVSGVSPGLHAVHVHERGDCSSFDALSAGPHWNPGMVAHGLPDGGVHHAGDIGNMLVGPDGKGTLTFVSDDWTIVGMDSVLGRALVVHQGVDDGLSQPAGDAGARAGCGLISLENQQPRAPRVVELPLDPKSGTTAAARLKLTETGNAITAELQVFGASQGAHQVRFHATADCSSADALSAGPEASGAQSLGVVNVGANGLGRLVVMNPRWLLGDGGITTPPAAADGGVEDRWPDGGFVRYDLAGRAVVLRAGDGPDAGARISCGVIR